MYKVKTNCEGCLFAEYDKKGKEQVACKLGRIPTFNPTFTKEKKDKDSKKCFVFDRFCNTYRPDEWLNHLTEEEKKDLKATAMDEVCPRMGFFIFLRDSSEDAISDMKKRLDELKTQTIGSPRYICIINPKVEYNEELQELLASSFDFEETEYHIVLSLVESGDLSLIDEAFKHGKNGWVYVGSSNEEIRTDIIEKVHNRINIELRRLVVVEPYDESNNGFIFQTAIYKLLGGNSIFTVEGEDQEVTFREKLGEMEIVDSDLVSSWEDFINGTP